MTTTQANNRDETRTIIGSGGTEQRTVNAPVVLSLEKRSDTKISHSPRGRTVVSTGPEENVLLRYAPRKPTTGEGDSSVVR